MSDAYRARVVDTGADDTVLTDVFDVALGRPWPEDVSGHTIANDFSRRWHGREEELREWAEERRSEIRGARSRRGGRRHAIWAGEASSFVTRVEAAGDVVAQLVREATEVLEQRPAQVTRDWT